MLRKPIGRRIVAVPKCVCEGVTCRESHVLVHYKIYPWSHEHLLPLEPQVMPSPLPFEVKLPAFAHGMIAEIAVPGVLVGRGDSVLRKNCRFPMLKNNNQKQKDLTEHGFLRQFPSRRGKEAT